MHHTYAYSYWTALCNGHQHHTCDYSYREAACGGRVRIQLRSELYTFEAVCAHIVPIKLSQNYLIICSPYSSVVCNVQLSCKDVKLGFVVLIGTCIIWFHGELDHVYTNTRFPRLQFYYSVTRGGSTTPIPPKKPIRDASVPT